MAGSETELIALRATSAVGRTGGCLRRRRFIYTSTTGVLLTWVELDRATRLLAPIVVLVVAVATAVPAMRFPTRVRPALFAAARMAHRFAWQPVAGSWPR